MLLRRLLTTLVLACLLLQPMPGSAVRAGMLPVAAKTPDTIVDCSAFEGPGDLVAALAEGGSISVTSSATIVLTDTITITKDTTLDGTGADVTFSGGGAVRLFEVAPGVSFTLINVTLTEGVATGLAGDPGAAGEPGEDGGDAGGGAIYNIGGHLSLVGCTLQGNSAVGGRGGNGGSASCATGGYLDAGNGGAGGDAAGGAICNAGGDVSVSGCRFSSNTATGGAGGIGGRYTVCSHCCAWDWLGWCVEPCSETLHGGNSGMGGSGYGGAIYNRAGTVTVSATSFDDDARGGDGGSVVLCAAGQVCGRGGGGSANGGSIYNDGGVIQVTRCTIAGSGAVAGNPGTGSGTAKAGDAHGGGVYNDGSAELENCTLSGNSVSGERASGGALHNAAGTLTLRASTVANGVATAQNGVPTAGGISGLTSAVTVSNTLMANSVPTNCSGALQSAGHNLDSGNSCGLHAGVDYVSATAALGTLGDNGGPTMTRALLAGSRAINTGAPGSATDQRGVARPQGSAPDIGAYEALGIGFSATSFAASEAAGSGVVTVTLSAPSPISVTVGYATGAGTATAGSDYTDISGTLTIPPGVASQALAVPILDDALIEPDETLGVRLADPTHALLMGTSYATLTIVDDDRIKLFLPLVLRS